MIYEGLLKCVNDGVVVDFCKLYILLCLSELPNTKSTVHNGLLSVMDNHFDELCKYNWGALCTNI